MKIIKNILYFDVFVQQSTEGTCRLILLHYSSDDEVMT